MKTPELKQLFKGRNISWIEWVEFMNGRIEWDRDEVDKFLKER